MKRFMMAVLVTMAAMCVTVPAFAGNGMTSDTVNSAGFSKLSEAEKAEVLKLVADKAAAQKVDVPGSLEKVVDKVTPTAEGVDKWMTVGEKFGKMMGGAAKEVGIAVNDFVKTPVGMMTAGLIVWHYTGGVMVHIFGGLLILVVGFTYMRILMNRSCDWVITYDAERKNVFGNPVVLSKKRSEMSDDALCGYGIAGVVLLIVSLIAIFTY